MKLGRGWVEIVLSLVTAELLPASATPRTIRSGRGPRGKVSQSLTKTHERAAGDLIREQAMVGLIDNTDMNGSSLEMGEKVKGHSLSLVTELLRLFAKEALTRAADQAKNEGDERVTIDHLEKILPQLLLDM